MKKSLETQDLDLAAYLEAVTGIEVKPEYLRPGLTSFHILTTPKTDQAILEYTTGEAMVNAKALLLARRRLYCAVRDVQRGY